MGFPNQDAYRHAAAAAGLAGHMHFTGRVPYDDAPEMLRILDIAVAPKRSESEGNGKVLNYMAAGLPVVAYDGPVARELLGSAGLRVPVGSVEGLARGLLRYLAHPGLRTRTALPSASASNANTAGPARSNTSPASTTPSPPALPPPPFQRPIQSPVGPPAPTDRHPRRALEMYLRSRLTPDSSKAAAQAPHRCFLAALQVLLHRLAYQRLALRH